MADGENEKPYSSAAITIGKVIGGAALAAGAVVLGTVIFQGLNLGAAPADTDLAREAKAASEAGMMNPLTKTLANVFLRSQDGGSALQSASATYTNLAGVTQTVEGFKLVADTKLSNLGMGIIGTGVAGAGYGLYSAMGEREETNRSVIESQESCDTPSRGGKFAEAEQVRALSALQMARLQATSPEHFAQMGQGRGA